ncbi:MAG TPA: tripartite tricarboxylate transporter substrate binding protein [Caldimonas sp.]|jgi:tripartite-type tricarboxylate transporter receptor subunit TctC|nr:tripartite tricarboxylate transporter substrate binding protein [Caldimonas sp.]HEX2541395.1 tripartite tricarboxylate transporter substrate binding protein [Caldimonas sp.]
MTRTKTTSRGPWLRLLICGSAALGALPAAAQAFPERPIKVLLSAPAGSSPDVVVRALAEAMEPTLGQPVVVENRPGAGGTLATSSVAAAPPDGYTLNVSGCSGDAITHAFVAQGRPPLVLFKDLTPVARLMRDHWLVLVPATSKLTSLQDLATAARSEMPAYPSQGEGSSPHLQGERLARALGFKALHVPYKESPIPDLVGGRLAYAVQPSAGAAALVKAGRLKALAVLSRERLPALADVPTAHEAGLPNYVFNGGVCMWAPGQTPIAVLQRLNDALVSAQRRASVRDRFEALGVEPVPLGLQETLRYVSDFAVESDRLRTDVFGATPR